MVLMEKAAWIWHLPSTRHRQYDLVSVTRGSNYRYPRKEDILDLTARDIKLAASA